MKLSKTEHLTNLVDQTLNETPFELVHLEYKKEGAEWVLRVYVDHAEGVNLDRCAEATRLISEMLDEQDPIEQGFQMEVSSPGIDRPLVKLTHFQRFLGHRVKIKLVKSHEGVKQVEGLLRSADEKQIQVESETDNKMLLIPMELISKANLKPILEFK